MLIHHASSLNSSGVVNYVSSVPIGDSSFEAVPYIDKVSVLEHQVRMRKGNSWIRLSGRVLVWAALFLPFMASSVLLGQFAGISSSWTALLALLCWIAIARFYPIRRGGLIALLIALFATAGYFAQQPSHDREWIPEIARLPSFQIEGNVLTAKNLRDFKWRSTKDYDERWIEDAYNLNSLTGLDVIVVPFSDAERAAHVMLSFGFHDGRRLAVSVETRPEIGEAYSLIGGAARQLELIYLFGTERDLLGLRILHRRNRVYSFPLKMDTSFAKELLLELCEAANQLRGEPKFYATLRHNCTTTLLRHVNRIRKEPIGLCQEIIFPAKLGELLHRIGYLDTNLDWLEAKKRFRADERVKAAHDLSHFSKVMRNEL